jgi:hypothetical protein
VLQFIPEKAARANFFKKSVLGPDNGPAGSYNAAKTTRARFWMPAQNDSPAGFGFCHCDTDVAAGRNLEKSWNNSCLGGSWLVTCQAWNLAEGVSFVPASLKGWVEL